MGDWSEGKDGGTERKAAKPDLAGKATLFRSKSEREEEPQARQRGLDRNADPDVQSRHFQLQNPLSPAETQTATLRAPGKKPAESTDPVRPDSKESRTRSDVVLP